MTARVKASTVMRTFEERVVLQAHREQTVVLELQVQYIVAVYYCCHSSIMRVIIEGGHQGDKSERGVVNVDSVVGVMDKVGQQPLFAVTLTLRTRRKIAVDCVVSLINERYVNVDINVSYVDVNRVKRW